MAYAVNFVGSNVTLLAPPGRDDVEDLHVMRNRGMVVSCWQLEPEEVDEVLRTGRIFLSVMGATMAPAFIGSGEVMRNFTADYGALPRQPTETEEN